MKKRYLFLLLLLNVQTSFAGWTERFLKPFDDLMRLDLDYERIQLKMAELQFEASEIKQKKVFKDAEQKACPLLTQALEEGGDVRARTIASLKPENPGKILESDSAKSYQLALKKIKLNQFDDAAQTMLGIVSERKVVEGVAPQELHYWLGFLFYKLKNYRTSLYYSNQVLDTEKEFSSLRLKAMTWKGLAYLKLKEASKSQNTFREIIQAYPKSQIARSLSEKN